MVTMPDLYCLICDRSLDVSSCVNIFYTSLPRNGELLVYFMSRVLRVAASDLCSSHICSQCYNLFQMLEHAQKTVVNIRCEILKIYRNKERKKSVKETFSNNVNMNVNTNGVFEESKLDMHNQHGQVKEASDLRLIAMGGTLEERETQDKTIKQSQNVSIIDSVVDTKLIDDSKENLKKDMNNPNELNDVQSITYHPHIDNKRNEVLGDIFQDSIELTTDKNVYNISSLKFCDKLKSTGEYSTPLFNQNYPQLYQCQKCKEKFSNISLANSHALDMHIGQENCIVLMSDTDKDDEKNCMKVDSIFSENKLPMQNITQSMDYSWNKIEESVTEATEDSQSIPEEISKHSVNPLKYSCSICDKKWKTSAELKAHVKTHSTIRPYMCEKCGQAYKHKHALEVHVGMHNGINPFQCSFCNKCFTQKGALMRHLPMHTGETPYQCELCGKRFIHHTSYNMHRLSHSGKKSYKCHMCDLSLLSTSHLKRHMRVHTGEKPYSCALCGKRFAERYNLFAHQKIHDPSEAKTKNSKEVEYKVSCCNLVFEKKQNLDDHMKCHAVTDNDVKESSSVFQMESKTGEMPKKFNSEETTSRQTWLQMNRSKLETIDDQTKFVFLQNPLAQIDESSFAVTFTNHKMSLESTNYNTSLQVIIESSETPVLNTDQLPIDKTHM